MTSTLKSLGENDNNGNQIGPANDPEGAVAESITSFTSSGTFAPTNATRRNCDVLIAGGGAGGGSAGNDGHWQGGGGGGGYQSGQSGGTGGKGIVIVRYKDGSA